MSVHSWIISHTMMLTILLLFGFINVATVWAGIQDMPKGHTCRAVLMGFTQEIILELLFCQCATLTGIHQETPVLLWLAYLRMLDLFIFLLFPIAFSFFLRKAGPCARCEKGLFKAFHFKCSLSHLLEGCDLRKHDHKAATSTWWTKLIMLSFGNSPLIIKCTQVVRQRNIA